MKFIASFLVFITTWISSSVHLLFIIFLNNYFIELLSFSVYGFVAAFFILNINLSSITVYTLQILFFLVYGLSFIH